MNNAFELYELVTDAQAVEQRGAFDYMQLDEDLLQACFGGLLNKDIAEKIIAAHKALHEANANGKFANNYYYMIEQQLSKIEL